MKAMTGEAEWFEVTNCDLNEIFKMNARATAEKKMMKHLKELGYGG